MVVSTSTEKSYSSQSGSPRSMPGCGYAPLKPSSELSPCVLFWCVVPVCEVLTEYETQVSHMFRLDVDRYRRVDRFCLTDDQERQSRGSILLCAVYQGVKLASSYHRPLYLGDWLISQGK